MEYEFTLKLAVPPGDADDVVERLGKAGCTDALVGIGRPGRVALGFTREARSAVKAIIGAIKDVKAALPESSFLEITPDFVGLSDVAELVGVTRQNMRKLMLKNTFPFAVHEGSAAVWHLYPVLEWLQEHARYPVPRALLDVARVAMQINLALEAKQLDRGVQGELGAFVA
jgi:predicted DNA-binding transcriptional regulator AlpA